MLSVLPEPDKPEERINDEKRAEHDAQVLVHLQGHVLPKDNHQPQHKVEAEHEEP